MCILIAIKDSITECTSQSADWKKFHLVNSSREVPKESKGVYLGGKVKSHKMQAGMVEEYC